MRITGFGVAAGVLAALMACGGSPTKPQPEPDQLPVAVASAPGSDLADVPIVFRGEQSRGSLANYRWNFGDGSAEQSGSDKVQVTYTYGCRARVGTESERRFTYTLTVTDTKGRTSSATGSILIQYIYDSRNLCAT